MSRNILVIVFLIHYVRVRVQGKDPNYMPHFIKNHGDEKVKRTTSIYNPHYGYEPYWVNGDWVFKEETLPPGVTTTSVPLVCGEECPEIYTSIGEVCSRQASNLGFQGCSPSMFSWYCSGSIIDDHSEGYETYPTYCKFLDRQCRDGFNNKLLLVHRGPCVYPQSEIFHWISVSDEPISRMKFYLTSLASLFDNYTLHHTIFDEDK